MVKLKLDENDWHIFELLLGINCLLTENVFGSANRVIVRAICHQKLALLSNLRIPPTGVSP